MPSTLASPIDVDIRTPVPALYGPPLVAGYAGAVVEVADLDRARRFYGEVLGFQKSPRPPRRERARVREPSSAEAAYLSIGGRHIVLCQRPDPRTLPDSGVHYAYRLPAEQLAAALVRLEKAGVDVNTYHEDRPAERDQNRYCLDPDGNRVQLVLGDSAGLDHAAVETHDVEWAEVFYTHVLGGTVETRVGWHMQDYDTALAWGEGRDDCAPGTRRWDKRYTSIEHKGQLPRPNAQLFVTFAPGVTLGVYLAAEHRQEPPPDQFAGTPRLCFRAGVGGLAALERRLREVRLRCLHTSPETGGPFERSGKSLFVRDPGGNFLEFQE